MDLGYSNIAGARTYLRRAAHRCGVPIARYSNVVAFHDGLSVIADATIIEFVGSVRTDAGAGEATRHKATNQGAFLRRGSTSQDAVIVDGMRALFWPLIALGSSLEVVAGAFFGIAAFSDPTPRGSVTYASTVTEVFGRPTSLSWSADRGMLVAAIAFAFAGLAAFAVAARLR
jgi:hypothetical protein